MLEKVINILTKRKKKEAKKKEKKNYHYCKLLAGQDRVLLLLQKRQFGNENRGCTQPLKFGNDKNFKYKF